MQFLASGNLHFRSHLVSSSHQMKNQAQESRQTLSDGRDLKGAHPLDDSKVPASITARCYLTLTWWHIPPGRSPFIRSWFYLRISPVKYQERARPQLIPKVHGHSLSSPVASTSYSLLKHFRMWKKKRTKDKMDCVLKQTKIQKKDEGHCSRFLNKYAFIIWKHSI